MKIIVKQINNESKNEFIIKYDNVIRYKAKLPFISINDPLNLEKIRQIKIFDTENNEIYTTNYNYIENLKEEISPLKYLITGSQKFNQLLFISNDKTIKIYYESKEIFNSRYVIEINNQKYFCYSIEDGYIRHFPIYDNEEQIGECLKSNVVIDEMDEYYCYLKDEYKSISDGISALLLYLDRSEYSSSYLVNRSYTLYKKYSFDKTNKFYDKNWVSNNFDDEYYKKIEKDVNFIKDKLKNPIKTWKEQWNSLSNKEKKLMKFVLIFPWIMIIIIGAIITLAIILT